MNVKLDDIVYIVSERNGLSISAVSVIMIGKDMFAHSYSFKADYVEWFRAPCHACEENTRWFKTLKGAKDYLHHKYKCRIKKIDYDYWEGQLLE